MADTPSGNECRTGTVRETPCAVTLILPRRVSYRTRAVLLLTRLLREGAGA